MIHNYPTNHPYVITITFDPEIYSFSQSTSGLTNVSTQPDVNGNTVLTGTFNAPFVAEEGSLVELEMCFERIDSWFSGPKDGRILFSVYDMDCDPPLLAFFNKPNINVVPYADLRTVPETRLSELLANGDVWFLNTGSLSSILIDDQLVVDIAAATFAGSSGNLLDVVLMPGARIRIESGIPNEPEPFLGMSFVNLRTCPDFPLAEGIVVEAQTAPVSFSKLSISNSILSDCRFVVNAQPNASILLSSNLFANNYIGVNLDMTSASSGQGRVRIDQFSDNVFRSDRLLKRPYSGMPEAVEGRGLCGIRLDGYKDFNVFSDIGSSLGGVNSFVSLANGILGFNSTGNIGNMTFSDMNSVDQTPVYQHEGFGIYLASRGADWFNIGLSWLPVTTFNNCKTGIRATNYAGKVEGTVMTNVNTGIDWSNSHTRDVRLRNNTITARHFGIRSGLNEPLHPISAISNNRITISGALAPGNLLTRGIEMNEIGFGYTPIGSSVLPALEGWDVGSDTVTMQQGGIGIGYRNGVSGTIHENIVTNQTQPADYTGILAEGIMGSDLTANIIDQTASGLGTSTAIHSSAGFANTYQCNCVDNTDIGLLFLDMAEFTDAVRGNSMNTHCTGLQLNAGAYIGEQNHTGNLWDLSAISGNCLGGRNFSDIDLSPFFVDGTANSAHNPAVFPSNWFKDELGTAFVGCAACTFPSFAPPRIPESSVPTLLDKDIANGDLYPDLFEHEMQWKGAYRLYRKMLRYPSMGNSQEFEDFKSDNDSLSTGRLAYIAEERSKIFASGTVQDSLLELHRLAWHEGMTDLLTLDSLRQAGDTSTSVLQYDSAVLQSTTARTQYADYLDTLTQARITKIQTLRMQNAGITATPTPAANHKTVNNIVFNLLLYDTLQTGDLTTLETIAGMCPLEGGDAVYEARALVAHLTGASYDDVELCAVSEERKHSENVEATGSLDKIILYPNPTTGLLTWSGTNGQTVLLRLYNNTGQLQLEQILTRTMVQIGYLPEGLYQIQLLDAKNKLVLASQKVLLIKR